MRVLHLYSGNLYGGIETVLVTLARERSRCAGMEPHFALCFEDRLSEELTGVGAEVHHLGEVRFRHPTSLLRARRALGQVCANTRFDLAIAQSPWVLTVLGPTVRAVGMPLVLWLHNPTRSYHWVDSLARGVAPDLLLCNSRFTAAAAAADYPGVPVEWVHSPVTRPVDAGAATRDRVRRELATAADAVVVVQASRLEPWKGHQTLLDALGSLRDVSGWVAWIAGGAQRPVEASYRRDLERIAREHGIADRVRFLGERRDVGAVLRAADVYCQPNHEPEPFGVVFIEALWARLPVVATDLGGPREIVDPTCGVVVPPRDAAALRAALEPLIVNPARRDRLGHNGPARAAELCDPETQLRKLHALLNRVVAEEVAG